MLSSEPNDEGCPSLPQDKLATKADSSNIGDTKSKLISFINSATRMTH